MKKLVFGLILLVLVSIFGCVNIEYDAGGNAHFKPPKEQFTNLAEREICCRSFIDIKYQSIKFNEIYSFPITSSLPKYAFTGGDSYFIAIELPSTNTLMNVEIKSYFDGYAFYPEVMVLDQEFNVITTYSRQIINFKNRAKFSDALLEGYFALPGKNYQPRYLLIYTSDELLELHHILRGRERYVVHYGPEGRVELEIRN